MAIGGPGILIVAFLDSSFLSLPLINDALVVAMVIRDPGWMPFYAAMATLGSVAGCYVLYAVAQKGGSAMLASRSETGKTQRVMAAYRRHGVLALVVPGLLPPPAPFKLFVLLAGAANVRPVAFVLAIALSRGVRYVALGTLTVWYGDEALAVMEARGGEVGLWMVALILVGSLAWWGWKRTRTRR